MSSDRARPTTIPAAVVETALDAIIVMDARGRVVEFNPAACEMFGYGRDEALDQPLGELIVPPAQRGAHAQGLAHYLATGEGPAIGQRVLLKGMRKGGAEFPVELAITAIGDHDRNPIFVAYLRDFTDLERARVDLEARERSLLQFRFMIDRAGDAVYWMGSDARFRYVNESACRMLRREREDLIGRLVFEIDARMQPEHWDEHWKELEARGTFTLESVHLRSDGSELPVEVSVNHVSFDGESFNCAIVRDISERRASEDAVRSALESAELATSERDQFIANLSHELRSPLTAILGFAELIGTRAAGDATLNGWLNAVHSNGIYLDRLLRDMLDLRSADQATLAPRLALTDLADLLGPELLNAESRARDKGLDFAIRVDDGLPGQIETDGTKLRQIIGNLLDNAVKYTDHGSIEVKLSFDQRPSAGGTLEARVSDTGIGIKADDQARIFDRFTRFAPEGSGGAGLGLAIVKELALALDAEIEFESKYGRGTSVAIRVETQLAENPGSLALVEFGRHQVGTTLQRAPLRGRVLLAEDSPSLATLYDAWLRCWGLDVVTVFNGREALGLAMTESYDAIMLDWRMPELDGLEVAEHLQKARVDAPILAITAHAAEGARHAWTEVGAAAYLRKPIEPALLYDTLAELLAAGASRPAEPVARTVTPPRIDDLRADFVEQLRGDLATLTAALDGGDHGAIQALAHRLRGSAPSFGFPALGSLAHDLEQAARKAERQRTEQLAGQLATAIEAETGATE